MPGRSQDAPSQALRGALRGAGLRATPSRLAVLNLLRAAERPLSHADVARALRNEPWDRTTLYRNLVDLVQAGLAFKAELGDRVWRFGAATAGHGPESHPHFVCTECGQVQCLLGTQVSLTTSRRAPQAIQNRDVAIQLRGRCDNCA